MEVAPQNIMRRGEILVARLNPNVGGEIGKIRPVLILLAQRFINAGSPVIMAAPLTAQFWPGMAALRTQITARGRLLKDSYVVLEQTRTLDRSRFDNTKLGELSEDEMQCIEQQLMTMFGLALPFQY